MVATSTTAVCLTALLLPATAAAAAAGHQSLEFGPYPDGSTMTVALAGGAGDAARVTVVPKGANASFLRYQGFMNASALAPPAPETFAIGANTSAYVILTRPRGWSLNVSRLRPVVSLSLNGTVVSADAEPPAELAGAACDPDGWQPLAPGIAETVASSGTCLRGVRTLSARACSQR